MAETDNQTKGGKPSTRKNKGALYDEWGQFTGIPNEFIDASPELSIYARWLFVLLRFHTNQKTKLAFPSYDHLKRMMDCSYQSVSNAVKELEKAGWLERKKRFGQSTLYQIVRPSQSSILQRTDSLRSRGESSTSQNSTRERVTRLTVKQEAASKSERKKAGESAAATKIDREGENGGGGGRPLSAPSGKENKKQSDTEFVDVLSSWIAKCCKGAKYTAESTLVRRTARALGVRFDHNLELLKAEHEPTLARWFHKENQLTLGEFRDYFGLEPTA